MCKFGDFETITIAPKEHFSPKDIPKIEGAASHRVNVDRCLAPLIEMLNLYGIKTIACCCGHGRSPNSSIRISAHNLDIIALGEDLTIHLKFPYSGLKKETTL